MDKFIYAVCNLDSESVQVKSIIARTYKDAQSRIIQKYWDRYDDLEEEEWDEFLFELRQKHGIIISDTLTETEEI